MSALRVCVRVARPALRVGSSRVAAPCVASRLSASIVSHGVRNVSHVSRLNSAVASVCVSGRQVGASTNVVRVTGSYVRGFAAGPSNAAPGMIVVPAMGDSITEGTVVEFYKKVGDHVNVDDVVGMLETDKVTVDIRSSVAGTVEQIFAEPKQTVKVGQELMKIAVGQGAPAAAPKKEEAKPAAAAAAPPKKEEAKPAAAASAPPKKEEAKPAAAAAAAPKGGAAKPAAPVASAASTAAREETRVPMSRMRLRIAERLKEAQNVNAMLTTFNEVDMTNLMELRNKYKDEFAEKHGVKLGFMSGFVKAATAALQTYPDVNAVIDGKDVVYRNYVDVSVAVATPTGLVVPVLRNTHTMSFKDIEAAIAALGEKARKGQIAIEDMVGGTFTISNGGVYGSLMGTPIINPPQAAILGMHGIFKRPIAVGDQVVVRPMMYVALTYDHRLIDGRGAVTFLRRIKEIVEDPTRLLLDL